MIGYTTVGTDNLNHDGNFYDSLLEQLNAKRVMQGDDFIAWGTCEQQPMFSIHLPADGQPASTGNGAMIALKTEGIEQVKSMYHKALLLGAIDEGKPGFRAEGFYAAYFRDLSGNKLNVHCLVAA